MRQSQISEEQVIFHDDSIRCQSSLRLSAKNAHNRYLASFAAGVGVTVAVVPIAGCSPTGRHSFLSV